MISEIPIPLNSSNVRGKELRLVAEGFCILTAAHLLPRLILGPLFRSILPEAPQELIAVLTSSAISPVIASFYLFVRTRLFPRVSISLETLYTAIAGIVAHWILDIVVLMIGGSASLASRSYLLSNVTIWNIMLIFIRTIWGPLIEETLFRGYFQEILMSKWGSNIKPLLATSLLFTIPHLAYVHELADIVPFFIYIFISSMIFGAVYIRAGLLAAFLVHSSSNLYRLII